MASLVLEGLPFEPGQPVEVLVMSKTTGSRAGGRSLRDRLSSSMSRWSLSPARTGTPCSDSAGHSHLGLAQEKFREAEPPLRKACTLNRAEENACYYLGRLLYTVGRLEEARGAFARVDSTHGARARSRWAGASPRSGWRFCRGRAALSGGNCGRRVHGSGRLRALPFSPGAASGKRRGAGPSWSSNRTRPGAEGGARVAGRLPVTAATVPVRFDESTLPMIVKNGAAGGKHLPETMLGGVAVFDYDNDGWPDIFVANDATMPGLGEDRRFLPEPALS